VTRQDLLSRIYTLPNNFGRVFRAAVVDNPNNPLGARLFIISRNSQKQLIISPDTLKDNLSVYLNQFRLISESIDILDAPIVNIAIKYSIAVEKGYNFQSVINEVNASLKDYFKIENFQINQPILISDVSNLILNTPGSLSLIELKFVGMSGVLDQTAYSNFTYVPSENLSRGMYYPPPGGIFEVKYPDIDIVGRAI
jgi:hypothetical protein